MHETAKELLQHARSVLDRNFRNAFHAWVESVEERLAAAVPETDARARAETTKNEPAAAPQSDAAPDAKKKS